MSYLLSATEIELVEAMNAADGRNDLFPAREGDKVAGRIAIGFARGLQSRLADGTYQPTRADFVAVRKPGLQTRPAAVLSLQDRVVYEALVARQRAKIARRLPPIDVVIWPRADDSPKNWTSFENSPLAIESGFVVHGDVAGFYESVDHRRLGYALAEAGVDADSVKSLVEFLGAVMGASKGIPQGLATSDTLATLYLADADYQMLTAGVTFARHGDDYRLWAATRDDATRSAHMFEDALRHQGLLANGKKFWSETLSDYSQKLNDIEQASGAFRHQIEEIRLAALGDMEEEELRALADEYDIDEDVQWRYFYHGELDLDDFRARVAPFLQPEAAEVLYELLVDALDPDRKLNAGIRHARIVYCLRGLSASKDARPIQHLPTALEHFPDKTDDFCSYLLAVAVAQVVPVLTVCTDRLLSKGYLTAWERSWLLRVIVRVGPDLALPAHLKLEVDRLLRSDGEGWLVRVEAARVLASRGVLLETDLRTLWRTAPHAYRGDVAGLVAQFSEKLDWSEAFLTSVRGDHLCRTIVEGILAAKAA